MRNELNLYCVEATLHEARRDGKKRRKRSDRWQIAASDVEHAKRKGLERGNALDDPVDKWRTERVEVTVVEQLGVL